MVFSLYSIVDGLMVAKGVGEYAMAAVNLAVPFTNVLFSIGVIFAVGTSTIIAIYLGQNQGEKANSLFSQNIVLLTCVGLTITVLVFVFLEPFAVLLGAKGVTYQYTIDYLRGLAPFALCFIISYNMEVLIKTDGYPRLAILTVITGCLANCVLDYIAIFVLNLGVWGAAVATGLSQLLTCIIYLRHFLGGHNTFHFVKFRMDWGIYKRLIPLGFADGVTELCNGVMIFLFNRVILRCLGDDGLVCYTIIAYVNTLIINTMLGISQGSQPLVSYHYGKGDVAGYKKLLRYGFTAVGIMTAVIFAGVMIFAPQIAGIFLGAEKPELLGSAAGALRRYGLCYLLLCGIHGGTAAHGNEAIGFEIEPVGFAQVVRVLKHAASEKQVLYELAAGGLQVIGKMFLEHFKQALVFLGGFDLFLRPQDDRDQVFGIDGL